MKTKDSGRISQRSCYWDIALVVVARIKSVNGNARISSNCRLTARERRKLDLKKRWVMTLR